MLHRRHRRHGLTPSVNNSGRPGGKSVTTSISVLLGRTPIPPTDGAVVLEDAAVARFMASLRRKGHRGSVAQKSFTRQVIGLTASENLARVNERLGSHETRGRSID